MTFGILQRYVIGEVVRAFAMALLTMTIIFVLFMVMAEATRHGLSPRDIINLVPFIVPSTLPYTVPVSMLFAVTVVYGRLASDNEIIAVKTAGLSAWSVLLPTIFIGGSLSAVIFFGESDTIPRSTHQARLVIFQNVEDMFYKQLKMDREFNNTGWPFVIQVQDVVDKLMLEPRFLRRSKDAPGTFDMQIDARTGRIKFDTEHNCARVYLEGAEVSGSGKGDDIVLATDWFPLDLPKGGNGGIEKRIQEWTTPELDQQQAEYRKLISDERRRQAMAAAFGFASGRPQTISWGSVNNAYHEYSYWSHRLSEFETEKQRRTAQSFGTLLFVILGAPVGILFAKRDFLSAFITCFVPIILLYYPLILLGVNLGKEGVVPPAFALWTGNVVLAIFAGFALPPVIRH